MRVEFPCVRHGSFPGYLFRSRSSQLPALLLSYLTISLRLYTSTDALPFCLDVIHTNFKMQLPSPEILASWPIPNYDNPETRGYGVLVVTSILFPIVLSIILIRLYTRLGMSKTFGLDDWLILAAIVPSTAFAILAILANRKFHFNRHVWDVPLTEVTFGLQYVIITQIVFTLAQTLTKCSMLALYYRILSSGQKFKIITIAAAIIIAIQGLIFIIVTIFQCRFVDSYLDTRLGLCEHD